MSSPNQLSLLRRTLAAIAAAAFVVSGSDALAQGKVKLTGAGNKDECSYSSMSITPDGSVTVQCSGSPPPPPPPPTGETFAMSTASMNAAAYAVVNFEVVRTGPAGTVFGATTVNFAFSGVGCAITGTYPVAFTAGQERSPISAPMGPSGVCTAALLAPPAPAALGTPSSTVITMPGGNPPGGGGTTLPPGCPALPQNMLNASMAGLGNPLLQMQASGQIVSIPLPSMGTAGSGQLTFGESAGGAYTPQPVTLEISINRCPGVIDTDYTNRCNIRNTNGTYNSITWLTRAYSGRGGSVIDAANANNNGLCWGGGTEPLYINSRWSYASCAFGAQVCGFAIQYNLGGYNN